MWTRTCGFRHRVQKADSFDVGVENIELLRATVKRIPKASKASSRIGGGESYVAIQGKAPTLSIVRDYKMFCMSLTSQYCVHRDGTAANGVSLRNILITFLD